MGGHNSKPVPGLPAEVILAAKLEHWPNMPSLTSETLVHMISGMISLYSSYTSIHI